MEFDLNTFSATARPKQKAARKRVFLAIKALIILAPLPFGCVGEHWRYIFFALLALIAFFAWGQVKDKQTESNPSLERKDPARDLLYGRSLSGTKHKRGAMVWAKRLWAGFFVFCLLQLLPLPAAVLKLISPHTVEIMTRLRGVQPTWLPLSQVPRETLVFTLELLVWTAFGMVLVRMRPGWREMTGLVRTLGWSAAFQVILGLVRLLSGTSNFFFFFAPWERKHSDLTGTLVNSNHFAFFLELVVPLVLALILVEFTSRGGGMLHRVLNTLEHRPKTLALLLILVLSVTGVVLSNSRAGLTALVAGVSAAALMMARTRQARLHRIMPYLAGVLVFFILIVAGNSTFHQFKEIPLESIDGGRIQRWPYVLHMSSEFPLLGTGMGTFRWAYFPYDKESNQWVTHAHNDVLETITEAGLVGVLLFFGALFLYGFCVIACWRRRNNVRVRLLTAGGMAAIVAAFFHSLFDFSLRIPSNALALVIIMALTWGIVKYRKTTNIPRSLRDGGAL